MKQKIDESEICIIRFHMSKISSSAWLKRAVQSMIWRDENEVNKSRLP